MFIRFSKVYVRYFRFGFSDQKTDKKKCAKILNAIKNMWLKALKG